MTTYTGNVANGEATITVDTTDMTEATYKILAEYVQNSKYDSSSHNTAKLVLTQAPSPVQTIEYGKGTSNPWTASMWNTIEIPSASGQYAPLAAHSNNGHRNSILQAVAITGDFTLVLNMNSFYFGSWNFGLLPDSTSTSNPVLKMQMGSGNNDVLNNSTNVPRIFTSSWNDTVQITIERNDTTYTIKYGENEYSFTNSHTGNVYWWMDKTGNGNIFVNDITITQRR